MTKDEALMMALEAFEQLDGLDTETECVTIDVSEVMNAIKEALAQPQQEPVAEYIGECSDGSLVQLYDDVKKGTKFYGIHSDYDTVALRDVAKLYAKYDALYKTQNVSHGMIAGALFDFMGWLTSRPKRIMLSSADEASPAVDAIKDFANMRGLSLDDAQVQTWQEALAQPQQEPVAWMREGWGSDCGPYIEFYRDDEMGWRDRKEWTALYTSLPAQRTWVGLTDDERLFLHGHDSELNDLISVIEAKLKAKNDRP